MPFVSSRPKLKLTEEDATGLQQLSQSRSEAAGRVQRAQILLRYHTGGTVSAIAAALRTQRPRVERCIAKALELGGTLGVAGSAGPRPTASVERGSARLGGNIGLPEAQGVGLRARIVDYPSSGQTSAEALLGRWSFQLAAAFARNGVQDFARPRGSAG